MKNIRGSVLRNFFIRPWLRYKVFVKSIHCGDLTKPEADIAYWREYFFASFITYLLPVCLIALVPGVFMAIKDHYFFIAAIDLLVVAGIMLVTFNCNFKLNFRKVFVVSLLYCLSIVLLVYLGLGGPGVIYLLALNVFVTLMFPRKLAYWSVALNLIICIGCAFVIDMKLFDSPLIKDYTLGSWIAVSSNLVFLSCICVLLIIKMIHGLENTIFKEYRLKSKLQMEKAESCRRNALLKESEGYYKKLFFQGPFPMWILDVESLRFLQVNESAIVDYGYSEQEFLSMTITDIKLSQDMKKLNDDLERNQRIGSPISIRTQHRRKNKEQFDVEVKFNSIVFHGKDATLVIAQDISEQIKHISSIEIQNKQLREIAYIQSHYVRAPLARIMGLVDLITQSLHEKPEAKLLHYLNESAKDLDNIISEITNNTLEMNQSD